MDASDQQFMKLALKEAQKAYAMGEVPIGAVIVSEGEIIASAHNRVELDKRVCSHAEILCIEQASHYFDNWRLSKPGLTLYTTLEPCLMCIGALHLARIDQVVYGAKRDRDRITLPLLAFKMTGGVLEEECRRLLQDFFGSLRKEKTT